MTLEKERLKNSLREAISKWADKNCESKGWEEMALYVHEDYESDMADAAWAVLDAMSKSTIYKASQE